MVWKNKTDKEIKNKMRKLCDVLEVDHLGLISESLNDLAKRFNEVNKNENKTNNKTYQNRL